LAAWERNGIRREGSLVDFDQKKYLEYLERKKKNPFWTFTVF
jgi:hypothetical protein